MDEELPKVTVKDICPIIDKIVTKTIETLVQAQTVSWREMIVLAAC